MPIVAYAVLAERKIAAFIQDRHGPNRVGWFGVLQPVADGVKSFLKEDFTPGHVRKAYFWLAPMIVMIPSLLVMAVIPFGSKIGGQKMVIADLNVGILYTFGIVSLGVYGIVLAGYASNSKYPFLGGIRSSAQMISYEIAMGMSVVPVFLWVGDLNLSQVIEYQAEARLDDLARAVVVRDFPDRLVRGNQPAAVRPAGIRAGTGGRLQHRVQLDEIRAVLHGGIRQHDRRLGHDGDFVSGRLDAALRRLEPDGRRIPDSCWACCKSPCSWRKLVMLMGVFIWVRWMWPRFRYDQLMDLGWRVFIPLALANIVATAVWLWFRKSWDGVEQ